MDSLLIGALELSDHLDSYGDGVLEATQLGTTQYGCLPPTIGCPPTLRCHIDDGALEATGADMALGPTQGINCPPPPTILHLTCMTDGALLRAAETTMSPPHTGGGCTILRGACATDDGALEAAEAIAVAPTFALGGCR